jgi:uncharacterized Tic20 family protein
MDPLLPVRTRFLAACCHLSGLSWIVIFYSISSDRFNSYLGTGIAGVISALIPLLLSAPLTIWLLTKNIHDFIDRSGRKALNYHCSIVLYGICLLFVMGISFGMLLFYAAPNIGNIGTSAPGTIAPPDRVNFFSSIFDRLYWVVSNLQYLLLIHTLNISIAAFFTLRGKVFSYPLAMPFFRNSKT